MPTDSENIAAIRALLEFNLSFVGLGLGFCHGITIMGGYMVVKFMRSVNNDLEQ